MTITLPLPDRRLSPNARTHWRVRHREGQAAKAEAYYRTLQALNRKPWPHPTARLAITFVLKDKRRHDIDNLFASMKPALDGMSQALQVDDSKFEYTLARTVDAKNPGVVVEVTE